MKEDYSTMVEALEDLKKQGYTNNFKVLKDSIECSTTNEKLDPDDCVVDKVYRFEGESNPSDMSVVYAISGPGGKKGALVSAYGAYSEPLEDKMIKLLEMDHHD